MKIRNIYTFRLFRFLIENGRREREIVRLQGENPVKRDLIYKQRQEYIDECTRNNEYSDEGILHVFDLKFGEVDKEIINLQRASAAECTRFWMGEAALVAVPLPEKSETGMWEEGRLTTKGVFTVRSMVRKERREQWESYAIRFALFLSILTFVMGLVTFVRSMPPQDKTIPGHATAAPEPSPSPQTKP